MKSFDVLVYSGHGGKPQISIGREKKDQQPQYYKLGRGNLTLTNSMEARTLVRVIRGFNSKTMKNQQDETQVTVYFYDGLYFVRSVSQERGQLGKLVFKMELVRNPDQPNVVPVAVSRGGGEKNTMKKKANLGKDCPEGHFIREREDCSLCCECLGW
ncbi:unnamed protein product [Linum trigynum]|uniref:YDG domain-containing protein n=1 Tax=Linum trigynum TaxID=586398 RepID=A0AAV2EUJ0_9ROSI